MKAVPRLEDSISFGTDWFYGIGDVPIAGREGYGPGSRRFLGISASVNTRPGGKSNGEVSLVPEELAPIIRVEFERMNSAVVQIVISGILLVAVAWSTFVDVFASVGTTGHAASFASFLIVRIVVILLLLWWFVASWRRWSRSR